MVANMLNLASGLFSRLPNQPVIRQYWIKD